MKKGLKISLIIVGAILLVYLVLAIFPRSNNYKFDNPMRTDSDLPILIAHGGGNKEFPDNTLEAFYNAYSVDQRVMMETDVSITKDGVVILSHDVTLDRKTNVATVIEEDKKTYSTTIVGNDIKQVDVYNTMGQLLKSVVCEDSMVNINVEDLQNGMYIVNVIDNNGEISSRKVTVL